MEDNCINCIYAVAGRCDALMDLESIPDTTPEPIVEIKKCKYFNRRFNLKDEMEKQANRCLPEMWQQHL